MALLSLALLMRDGRHNWPNLLQCFRAPSCCKCPSPAWDDMHVTCTQAMQVPVLLSLGLFMHWAGLVASPTAPRAIFRPVTSDLLSACCDMRLLRARRRCR